MFLVVLKFLQRIAFEGKLFQTRHSTQHFDALKTSDAIAAAIHKSDTKLTEKLDEERTQQKLLCERSARLVIQNRESMH